MLRQPAADSRDAAVRWRQLVDLIARAGGAADPDLLREALDVIRTDSARIDEALRAAAARAIAALPLPLGLLECFVADRLAVSAPILAAATLDSGQWRSVLAAADAETRRFIETLHPDVMPLAGAGVAAEPAELSIGELVSRIERRRTERGPQPRPETPSDVSRSLAEPRLFQWETGASGDIEWVEGVPRGAMIGRSLAKAVDSGGEHVAEEIVRAFASRAPFRDRELVIVADGPAGGRWLVSGAPNFEPGDGRFSGFRGTARREEDATASVPAPAHAPHLPLDSNSLRELVHELRTPLNAIIGFSEIIDGQFLGPAGRRYRDRANDIAGEARVLLSAIEDLDLAATAQAVSRRAAANLASIVTQMAAVHLAEAKARGVELHVAPPAQPVTAAVEADLLARLIGRLLGSVILVAASGERLSLAIETRGHHARLAITCPAALAGPGVHSTDSDYTLRLARGLARIAGGDVSIEEGLVVAAFPAG